MGTDGDGRARLIGVIGVAVLCCAAKHVAETRCLVGRSRLSRHGVFEPLHPHLIDAHRGSADPVLVAGHADPPVGAIAEDMGDVSVVVHLCHGGISGDPRRAGAHRPRDFDRADNILVRLTWGIAGRLCGNSRAAVTPGRAGLRESAGANGGHRRSEKSDASHRDPPRDGLLGCLRSTFLFHFGNAASVGA
jgi:hypothetical protein